LGKVSIDGTALSHLLKIEERRGIICIELKKRREQIVGKDIDIENVQKVNIIR